MSDSFTGLPLPVVNSNSSVAFDIISGLRTNSLIAHSTVDVVVSVPAINKSCDKCGIIVLSIIIFFSREMLRRESNMSLCTSTCVPSLCFNRWSTKSEKMSNTFLTFLV
ncbi:hypothetical protein V8G54_014520 [Vigna mungo]|uniref:Uncharacterized protein n=1 Tax=Vigna mungo TaxID=3915 RepID=A0AAQ3NGS3_VIGMU